VNLNDYKSLFLGFLQEKIKIKDPENLYKPVKYILQIGGKRLRPILVLISAEAFGKKSQIALDAALSVEVFHNFTLLHDDIMDQAPIRRGQATVHEKWDVNTGILSGDVMLINSYQYIENYEPVVFKALMQLIGKTAVEVCEGQQYDMDFETRQDVSLSEYLKMIKFKTSVLVGAALQMGAIVAGASKEEQEKIYDFGIYLGLAFQLQDDYLDTFGDEATFGKQIGGDILENKKTWLYLKTLEIASASDAIKLKELYSTLEKNEQKVNKVKSLFEKYQINNLIKEQISLYSTKALDLLENLKIKEMPKNTLKDLVNSLEKRNQ
jgi:geranylgeranyl diphosphate synthase type II